jgi:hypothetical protein
VLPPKNPELLKCSVNTNCTVWCFSGTSMRITTTAAAPITCHQTDTFCSTSMIRCPKMLINACNARITRNR